MARRLRMCGCREWHPGGHGLHVHFAVGRFIRVGVIREAWPHGYTSIKLLGDLPVGSGAIEEARLGARYLARYVGRTVDEERADGLHRYEVAQGFQPGRVIIEGVSGDEVLKLASEWFKTVPVNLWRSESEKDWHGPPAVWPPGRGNKPGMAAATRLWVESSCAQQGLAVKITDPMVLAAVGALLERGQGDETALAGKPSVEARQTGVTRVGSKRLRPRRPGPITR